MMTILDALKKTAAWLEKKGFERGRLEAEVLLAHVLGCRRLDLYLNFQRPLTEDETNAYREAVRRRSEGEPVAYITGRKEFFGFDFEVTSDVLIPRPETEELVELAVEMMVQRHDKGIGGGVIAEPIDPDSDSPAAPARMVERCANTAFEFYDVGTGSGAIAVTLLKLFPQARGWAGDISGPALEVARRNADALGVSDRLTLLEGDIFAGVERTFDLIISNPPYVRDGDVDLVTPSALRFEPHGAIFSGPRGTEIIARILDEAPKRLKPGGMILMEIAPMIEDAVSAKIKCRHGFAGFELRRDLAGKIRFLILDFSTSPNVS